MPLSCALVCWVWKLQELREPPDLVLDEKSLGSLILRAECYGKGKPFWAS
jgi:hypothetical protein